MKKILLTLLIFIIPALTLAHMGHYNNYNKIEMEIYRNGELIGYNYYFFNRNGEETIVKNQTPVILALDSDMINKTFSIAKDLTSYGVQVKILDLGNYQDVGSMPAEIVRQKWD